MWRVIFRRAVIKTYRNFFLICMAEAKRFDEKIGAYKITSIKNDQWIYKQNDGNAPESDMIAETKPHGNNQ